MAYTNVYKGIIFIEGTHPSATTIYNVKCDLSFKFGSQLKNLFDVKDDLAQKAKSKHCNCIINFKYGQKSKWLSTDNVAFWGEGQCAKLPEDIYYSLVNQYNSN